MFYKHTFESIQLSSNGSNGGLGLTIINHYFSRSHPGNGQFVHRRCSMEREIDGFRCRSCWVKSKVCVVPECVRGKYFFLSSLYLKSENVR